MDKIVKVSPEINPDEQNRAESVHKEILVRTAITANNLIELGKLFKEVRDKKLYKLLGAETFGEYCGFPEISFGRSTIYSFIHVYELFVLELDTSPNILAKIGHRKLQIISSVVKKREVVAEAGDWLSRALHLSESDLINEVRSAQGKKEMLPAPKEVKNAEYYKFNRTGYVAFVTQSPCILHPDRKSENAHFPRTKKRGAEYWEIIPLCHSCHMVSHQDTFDFLWLNRVKIFKWFYSLLIGGKE